MWYAQNSARRTHQLVGDAVVFLWTALWATAAVLTYRLACLLALPKALQERRAPFPLIGGSVDTAVRRLTDAVDAMDPVLVRVGVAVGALALFLVPVGLLLVVWLPRRLRWIRQAGAARNLAASDDGRDLLALRSLLRPLDELAGTASEIPGATPGSLAWGWRQGDPEVLEALAGAELERLGLEAPPLDAGEAPPMDPPEPVELIAPSPPGDDRTPDPHGVS
ncbi:hypothetical protein [Streptomyces flavofungini]|uniref:hypothetical protein n=1 Tax=Streptomyces flavofungini TaxID=68200 RepID=UPI0034DE011A